MKVLYFDCFSGVAGDMILGALLDAGLPLGDLRCALGSLAIDREAVWTERVSRAGVSATKFHVRDARRPLLHPQDHQDEHGHGHATHRTIAEIFLLIDGAALSTSAKSRAKAIFGRLAEAEATVHDTPIEEVHLHEVGALDSIIDIVGTVYAFECLGLDRIVASPLNVGSGSLRNTHGLYPVPAPATTLLLQGTPIYSGPQQHELVTPTGALLVTAYADSFGPLPPMRLERIGYGAGTRDHHDAPNVLRLLIGESDTAASVQRVVVIEAEVDDMNPQIFGILIDRLLTEGALDVFYTSIQMKKNRPGTLLSIIATPDVRERLSATVFRETTTIGLRCQEMERECLDRETLTVETPLGPVGVKIARRNGEVMNTSPEFEDCVRIAAKSGRPIKEVQAATIKAFLDRS